MKDKKLDKYYRGQWNARGTPEGKGILYEPGFFYYEGELKDVPHGRGTIDFIREGFIYEGNLAQGKANG